MKTMVTRETRPKISFVVVARNDNYGGDFLSRMQAFVNVVLTLSERYGLSMELVIVEWNPPKDNPRLADALTWLESPRHCQVRFIEVPLEMHRQFPHSERTPLFEFIGKNVGVRRAKGEFILVTNPDILFGEELIRFLSSTNLSSKYFYRTARYDVEGPFPTGMSVEEQLAYCQQHITRINAYFGSFDNRLSEHFDLQRILYACLDYIIWRLRYFPLDKPFTNASGDFFMMHRSHWHSLRGYPQIIGADKYGLFHTDSFMMYQALFHGLRQVRLGSRLRIYHLEHDRKRDSTLFSPEVDSTRQQLLKARKPIMFNDETWGLGANDLSESVVA